MPQSVEIRGYGSYDFPDDWDDDKIRQVVRERIAQRDRGKVTYGPVADVGLGAVRGFAGTLGSGAAGLADLFGAEEAGQSIRQATDIQRPLGFQAPGSTAAGFGEMLGGAGAFVGATAATALAAPVAGVGAGLGALVGGAVLGAGTGVEEQRQRRVEAELEGRPIDENSKLLSALGGAAIGTTEALPFGRLARHTLAPLGRLLRPGEAGLEAAKKLAGPSLVKNIGIQAAEEGAQEAFSHVAQGTLEKQLYSPDRDAWADVGEAAAGGAGIGALLELGLRGPGRVVARRRYRDALESGATESQALEEARAAGELTKPPKPVRTAAEQPQLVPEISDEDSILDVLMAEEPRTERAELAQPAIAEPLAAQAAPVAPPPVVETPVAPPSPLELPGSPDEPPLIPAIPEAGQRYRPAPTKRDVTFFTGSSGPLVEQVAGRRDDVGLMISPLKPDYVSKIDKYPVVGIDNGAFSTKKPFSAPDFRKLLNNVIEQPGAKEKVRFVAAPDVVGDAEATLKQFKPWADEIHSKGLPVAFVGQNGLEDMHDRIPWDDFEVLFIGGDTAWKLGQHAGKPGEKGHDWEREQRWINLFKEAKARGKEIHVGRVNSDKRVEQTGFGLGASTVDGTFLAFGPDKNLPQVEQWLDNANFQASPSYGPTRRAGPDPADAGEPPLVKPKARSRATPPEPPKPGDPPPVEAPVEAVPAPEPPPVRRSLAEAFWDQNSVVTPDDLNQLVRTVQGGVPVRKAIDQVFGDRALDARPVLERRLNFIERTPGPKSTFELTFDPNDYDIPGPPAAQPQGSTPEPTSEGVPAVPTVPVVPAAEGDWRAQTLGKFQESLAKMKLDQKVGVELADSIMTRSGQRAEGEYDPDAKTIRLSLDLAGRSLSERQQHLAQVLDHEVVHVARPLFTEKEWTVLAREARKRGHLATAEELYKDQPDYSPELAVEESVANLIRDRAEGAALPSTMTGLYNRFVDYMTRFGNAFRGQGLQTADDVFQRLRTGEVGGRAAANLQPGNAEGTPRYALPRPEPPPSESQRVIDAAKLIRAGQPVDAKAFTHPADLDYAQRLAKNNIDLDRMRAIDPDSLFNIGKLELNDRTKEHLRNEVRLLAMTEGFDPKKRVGFDQVRREANALLGQHVPLDVQRLKSGETLHPSVRLAMAKLVRQAQAEIVRTTDALTKGATNGSLTTDQQLAEQHRLDVLRAERDRILSTLIPARTQDGRNLVMHRIEVQSSFDPVYWNAVMKRKLGLPPHINVPADIMEPLNTALGKGQAAKDAFDAATEEGDPKKTAKAEKDLVEAKKAVAKEAQKFERTKPLEALLSLWKAGLLTGPPTQIANFTSNASFAALEKLASMPAAWIDTALSYTKLGDGRRTVLNQMSAGAWDRAFVGAIAGAREGAQQLKSAVAGRAVEGGQQALARIDVPRSFNLGGGNLAVRGVENYVNGVFGMQMAADRPFFRSAEAVAAREVAKIAALNESKAGRLPPGATIETRAADLEQRMARQRELGNKDPQLETLNTEVKAIADFATFANENFGSRGFQSAKRGMEQMGAAGKAAAFLAEGVVPFVKVPTNVFQRIIEYSPAGVAIGSARMAADAIVKKSLDAKSQRLYSQLIGRGLVGSALMFLGYKAAEAGLMTGFRDEQDTGGRTADAAAGHPQGALYVGNNKWAQIGRISPGGNLLVIGASLYREGNRPLKDISKQTGNLYAAATQSVMEMPFMMGAENLIDAVKNPGSRGSQYLVRQLGTAVPAIVARAAAAGDPLQRETKAQGPLAGVKARLPGVRATLPARSDVLGRPLEEAGVGPVGRFADPFRTTSERQDPVSQEILRTQFELGVPQVKKDEERPTYLLRAQLAGELYRQKLAEVIGTPEYQESADEVKRELLKDAKEAGGRDLSRLTTYNAEYKEATEAERRQQLERYLAAARTQ